MNIFVIGGVTVARKDPLFSQEQNELEALLVRFGRLIVAHKHNLIVCSPYNDSADFYVFKGVSEALKEETSPVSRVEFHCPQLPGVLDEVMLLTDSIPEPRVQLLSYSFFKSNSDTVDNFSWLFTQIKALENSSIVICVGGKDRGSASLLLRLAEGQDKAILPIPILGGAAEQVFEERSHSLQDKLGPQSLGILRGYDTQAIWGLVEQLSLRRQPATDSKLINPRFFISYARARPSEADLVETLLRRRNKVVFRDEENFKLGGTTLEEINGHLENTDVFIAIWCKEYACSPWCFDELSYAIEKHEKGELDLWIICVDDTRMVHPGARNMLFNSVGSREEIEGLIVKQLLNLAN